MHASLLAFRPKAEVSFPCTRQVSEYNGKEASTSREHAGHINQQEKNSADLENEVSKIFIISLRLIECIGKETS